MTIYQAADIRCLLGPEGLTTGGAASRDKVRIPQEASIQGVLVSLEGQVDLMNRVSVEGSTTAIGDVSLSAGASLSGNAVSGADIVLRNGSVIEGDSTAAHSSRREG